MSENTGSEDEAFVVPIGREIDLHTFRPKDIPFVVEDYLLEARQKGFRELRIVHGKGIGYQREVVRKVLALTEFVESFADDLNGNKGATTVILKP